AEPTAHVILWKRGARKRSGAGLTFWFRSLGTSLAEVPLDDRELAFVFRGRSADFQETAVNGSITWRVVDPELLASRLDFSVDPKTGRHNKDPLDRIAGILSGLAQGLASTFLNGAPLRQILDQGIEVIRRAIHEGLVADAGLAGLGIEIVGTAVGA